MASTTETKRLPWVDAYRGILIAHMALDHSSLMINAQRWGEELAAHSPGPPASLAQFLTRFTGVAVAPGFSFMAGFMVALTSARRAERGMPEREISRTLLIRGIVLILVDTVIGGLPRTVMGFYSFMVLSSIGVSIIALSYARKWPRPVLLALALAIMILHPLLDVSGLPLPLRAVIYEPVRTGAFRSLYPIIPWIGVVMFGFVIGSDAATREKPRKLWLGLSALSFALFFAVRLHGGFGNAYSYTSPTSLDFWFFAKYPPDLAWLTWSFGQIFFVLAALHWISRDGLPRFLAPFTVYGRVPFFFYIVHFYLLGPMGQIIGKRGLPETFALWIGVLAVMYPLCRWYERKKRERPNFVTRYF